MAIKQTKLIELAATATRETKYIDFKSTFEIASSESWCEVIKDIVAMANSGGGIIVFGVANDGTTAPMDHSPLLAYDTADITNKIARYTNYQFDEIDVVEVQRGRSTHAAFLISETEVPLVFTKPGTYQVTPGQQKTAFGQGTIYFRHGSKSEHGNRNDLSKWHDREMAKARKAWTQGMRKVAEAGPGDTFTVISASESSTTGGSIIAARLGSDPAAPQVVLTNVDDYWPHRQMDVIEKVNTALSLTGSSKINQFDIKCVIKQFDIYTKNKDFAYKAHRYATPVYSEALVEWLIDQYQRNRLFFQKAREHYKASNK